MHKKHAGNVMIFLITKKIFLFVRVSRVFVVVFRVFVKRGGGGIVNFYSFGAKPVQNNTGLGGIPCFYNLNDLYRFIATMDVWVCPE